MTMAPYTEDTAYIRQLFKQLRVNEMKLKILI